MALSSKDIDNILLLAPTHTAAQIHDRLGVTLNAIYWHTKRRGIAIKSGLIVTTQKPPKPLRVKSAKPLPIIIMPVAFVESYLAGYFNTPVRLRTSSLAPAERIRIGLSFYLILNYSNLNLSGICLRYIVNKRYVNRMIRYAEQHDTQQMKLISFLFDQIIIP